MQNYAFWALALLTGCTPLKRMPADALFLADVQVRDAEGKRLGADADFNEVLRQRPNKKFLGVRLPMRIHMMVRPEALEKAGVRRADSEKPEGGLRWWLTQRMGEAPAIHDAYLCERSRLNLEALAQQMGYLDAKCSVRVDTSQRKVDVNFALDLGAKWTIDAASWMAEGSGLEPRLSGFDGTNLIGEAFNVRTLDEARGSIASSFRNRGFPTVQASHIAFIADTARAEKANGVKLTIELLPFDYDATGLPVPHQMARFGGVSWSCLGDAERTLPCLDSEMMAFMLAMDSGMVFNERVLQDTYRRMAALPGVGRVEMPGTLRPGGKDDLQYDVNVGVELNERFSAATELQMIRSDARYGPIASIEFRNNNLSGRGDALEVAVSGGIVSTRPFSYTSEALVPNSGTWSVQGEYSTLGIPPLPLSKLRPSNQARTFFQAQWMRELRPEYAREAVTLTYGFSYVENPQRDSKFNITPLEFRYSNITKDEAFESWLDDQANPILSARFNDYSAVASKLEWRSNWTGAESNGRMRLGLEWTGMGMRLLAGPLGLNQSELGAYLIGGIPFAQYVRGEAEWTIGHVLSRGTSVHGRLKVGAAGTGANAEALPFDRAFFAGGANGVRGWSVRDLGPGFAQQADLNAGYVPGVGDVQLEWSMEWRQELTGAFGVAWFTDAGNVWIHGASDSSEADVHFTPTSIAWGGGLGVRLDFEFFLLRLDGALRLYDPSQPAEERWLNLSQPAGMVHLGIGHPF